MGLNHKVENVGKLLEDSKNLLENITNGASNSAYGIIKYLDDSYTILTGCWKGMDAGVQINNIVTVYNAMVTFRRNMADMAIFAHSIGIHYREIQSLNGANVEVPAPINDGVSVSAKAEYHDNTDTIDITPEAMTAKNKLDIAKNSFEDLKSSFASLKNAILSNWTAGDRHDEFEGIFQDFESSFKKYEELLNEVCETITKALANYGG